MQLGPDAPVQRRRLVGGKHDARAERVPGDGRDLGDLLALRLPGRQRRRAAEADRDSARAAELLPLDRLGAVEGTGRYVHEVKRIQDSLSEAVFFGEVLGHEQIQLGHEPAYGVEYNVFRSLKTGRRVCILTNSGRRGSEPGDSGVRGEADGACGSIAVRLPSRCRTAGQGDCSRRADRVRRGTSSNRLETASAITPPRNREHACNSGSEHHRQRRLRIG